MKFMHPLNSNSFGSSELEITHCETRPLEISGGCVEQMVSTAYHHPSSPAQQLEKQRFIPAYTGPCEYDSDAMSSIGSETDAMSIQSHPSCSSYYRYEKPTPQTILYSTPVHVVQSSFYYQLPMTSIQTNHAPQFQPQLPMAFIQTEQTPYVHSQAEFYQYMPTYQANPIQTCIQTTFDQTSIPSFPESQQSGEWIPAPLTNVNVGQSTNVINTHLETEEQKTERIQNEKRLRKEEKNAHIETLKNESVPHKYHAIINEFGHKVVEFAGQCQQDGMYKGAQNSKQGACKISRLEVFRMNQDLIRHHNQRNVTDNTEDGCTLSLNFLAFEIIIAAPCIIYMIRRLVDIEFITLSPSSERVLDFTYTAKSKVELTKDAELYSVSGGNSGTYFTAGSKFKVVSDPGVDQTGSFCCIVESQNKHNPTHYIVPDPTYLKKQKKGQSQWQAHLRLKNQADVREVQKFYLHFILYRLMGLRDSHGNTFAQNIADPNTASINTTININPESLFWDRDVFQFNNKHAQQLIPQFLTCEQSLHTIQNHIYHNIDLTYFNHNECGRYQVYDLSNNFECSCVTGVEHCVLSSIIFDTTTEQRAVELADGHVIHFQQTAI